MQLAVFSTLATAALPAFSRAGRGATNTGGSGPSFDYYIAPASSGGSMSNAGTVASPWAIDAIWENSTVYAGKRIGFLPGNYGPDCAHAVANWISYITAHGGPSNVNPSQSPWIPIQGGSPDSPTYVGSSDSNGNYSPRTAILDFHPVVGSLGVSAYVTGITILNSTQFTLTVNAPSANSGGILVSPFANGDTVYFYQISGMTGLNGQTGTISNAGGSAGAWTYTVTLTVDPSSLGTWTSGSFQFAYVNYPNIPNGYGVANAVGYGTNQQVTGGSRVASNVTIDGLVITGVFGRPVFFYSSTAYGLTGITLQNCDIYDCSGPENDNTGGPYFENTTGTQIVGNCIHDIGYGLRQVDGAFDIAGLWIWQSKEHYVARNTIYDCGVCAFFKSGPQGSYVFTQNMLECDPLYPSACFRDGSESDDTLSGLTSVITHNIMMPHGSQAWYGIMSDSGSNDIYDTTFAFNTIYSSEAGAQGINCENGGPASYPVGQIVGHYCNIYDMSRNGALNYLGDFSILAVSQSSTSPYGFTTLSCTLSDYNCFDGTTSTAVCMVSAYAAKGSPFTPNGSMTLPAWQAATSFDTHSANGTPTYQGALTNLNHTNPTGFKLVAGSTFSATGAKPGSTTGTTAGAPTDMGAYGNGNTQVGCGFLSNAPDRI